MVSLYRSHYLNRRRFVVAFRLCLIAFAMSVVAGFSAFAQAQSQSQSPNYCQSETFCVHDEMPLWSQMDAAGNMSFNDDPTALLQYVQQHGVNVSRDPGWCGGVSSAMILRSFYREISTAGRGVPSNYSWLSGDPSQVIFNTFGLVGTNVAGGGTYLSNVYAGFQRVLNDFAVPLDGGSYGSTGMDGRFLNVSQFRATRPLVELHIYGALGHHAVVLNGTDGNYFKIFDPWGSALNVSYDGSTLRYASSGRTTYVSGAANFQNQQTSNEVVLTSPAGWTAWGQDGSVTGRSFTSIETRVGSGANIYTQAWMDNYGAPEYAPRAPTVIRHPASVTINQGKSATLSVVATGYPVRSYSWKRNGVVVAGATQRTLTISNAGATHAGDYTAVVTNSAGSVTSNVATVTVRLASAITTQPAPQVVNAGASATFSVVATGEGTLSYQWKKNGTVISGATQPSYSISNVQSSHVANYTVVVTNTLNGVVIGSTTSSAASLSIRAAPTITTQPVAQVVRQGASVSFSVAVSGTAPFTYQWKKDGEAVSGATSASYSIASAQASHAGQYSVVVTNGAGSATSASASLTVRIPPAISTQPLSQTINQGSSVTFSVVATGTAPFTYQWKKGGVAISGAASASYTITNAQPANDGQYTVVVTNAAGTTTSNAAALSVRVPPAITTQPLAQAVNQGSGVTFSVAASGTAPFTYQWKKNGTAISGATGASYSIASVQPSHAGQYTVVVTNAAGSATSNAANLNVRTPPSVTTVSVAATVIQQGQSVSLSVTAAGNPAPELQWYHDGVAIAGANGPMLELSQVEPNATGTYTVRATNVVATVNITVTALTVQYTPVILTQPVGSTSQHGSTVTLSIAARGVPEPTVQWYRNNLEIPGATTTELRLESMSLDKIGSYTAVVTNVVGSTRSNAAVIRVMAPLAEIDSAAGLEREYPESGVLNRAPAADDGGQQ